MPFGVWRENAGHFLVGEDHRIFTYENRPDAEAKAVEMNGKDKTDRYNVKLVTDFLRAAHEEKFKPPQPPR